MSGPIETLVGYADDLTAGEEIEKTNALLRAAIRAEYDDGPLSSGGFVSGETFVPDETGGESSDGQVQYDALNGVSAGTEWQNLSWGRPCDTVVIHNIGDNLDLALKPPNSTQNARIPIESGDDPFNIAGVFGIEASQLWYKQASTAGGSFTFDVLALRSDGGRP
jgi:hypothetical protein